MAYFEQKHFGFPMDKTDPIVDDIKSKMDNIKNKLKGMFINAGNFKNALLSVSDRRSTKVSVPRITITASPKEKPYQHYPQLNFEINISGGACFIYMPPRDKKYTDPKIQETYDRFVELFSDKQIKNKLEIMAKDISADYYNEKGCLDIRFTYKDTILIQKDEEEIIKLIEDDFTKLVPIYKDLMDSYRSYDRMKEEGRMKDILLQFLQIVLCGPPGTGKTWMAKRLAARLLGIPDAEVNKEEKGQGGDFFVAKFPNQCPRGSWSIVQFHPSYNYEDFVRGIHVRTSSSDTPVYDTVDKIIGDMAKKAKTEWDDWMVKNKAVYEREKNNDYPKYFLIVDEINRANVAAVLGELIYALEYRACEVDTPYKPEGGTKTLSVPPNLYIIGTMNTADRSVGHIDYAVRRRFAFIPLLPRQADLELFYDEKSIGTKSFALKLYKSVEKLFKSKENSNQGEGKLSALSPDFHCDDVQPGHTYFMELDNERLIRKFMYQVYPLLREYYKDGVLVKPQQGKLALEIEGIPEGTIRIDEQMNLNDLYNHLKSVCGQDTKSQVVPTDEDTTENEDGEEGSLPTASSESGTHGVPTEPENIGTTPINDQKDNKASTS